MQGRFQSLSEEAFVHSPQTQQSFGWIERFQQLTNAEDLSGQDQAGRQFAEGLQHKAARVRPRMRQAQPRRTARLRREGDQVEIQLAGFVQNLPGLPAELAL